MITLHVFGPKLGLPDLSPPCMKAHILLKLAGLARVGRRTAISLSALRRQRQGRRRRSYGSHGRARFRFVGSARCVFSEKLFNPVSRRARFRFVGNARWFRCGRESRRKCWRGRGRIDGQRGLLFQTAVGPGIETVTIKRQTAARQSSAEQHARHQQRTPLWQRTAGSLCRASLHLEAARRRRVGQRFSALERSQRLDACPL